MVEINDQEIIVCACGLKESYGRAVGRNNEII